MRRRDWIAAAASVGAATLLGCTRRSARTTVKMWFSYGGKNRQTLEAMVGRFNASQSAVRIEATFQGDYFEALTKLRAAIAAGVAPTFTHVVGEVLPYLAEANVLEELDGYPGAQELDFVPALAQCGTWIGGSTKPLYALPFNRSTPIMYLNQELLREAGLHPPTTWQELRTAAGQLKRSAGDQVKVWGLVCPISWWFWVALVQQAGGTVVEADGTPTLGGAAGVRALQYWQDLVHRDRSMRPPPGRDYNAWEVTNGDFLAARAAMIYTSTAFARYIDQNARFRAVAVPLPRADAASRPAVPTGGTFFVVLRQAPRQQKLAAWEFLRWMSEPEQVIEWATSTGYLPVTTQAAELLKRRGYYQEHPNDLAALLQLDDAVPWPWAPNLFRVERECIDPLIEEAVLLPRDAQTVMEQARRRAREE